MFKEAAGATGSSGCLVLIWALLAGYSLLDRRKYQLDDHRAIRIEMERILWKSGVSLSPNQRFPSENQRRCYCPFLLELNAH